MTHKNIWACSGYMQLEIYFDLQFLEFTDVDPWVWRNYYLWGKFQKRQSSRTPAVGWAELEWGASVLGKHLWAPPSHKHEMFIHGLDFRKHTLWWMLTFALPSKFKWKYSECHGQASQWSELLPRMPVAKLGCKKADTDTGWSGALHCSFSAWSMHCRALSLVLLYV